MIDRIKRDVEIPRGDGIEQGVLKFQMNVEFTFAA